MVLEQREQHDQDDERDGDHPGEQVGRWSSRLFYQGREMDNQFYGRGLRFDLRNGRYRFRSYALIGENYAEHGPAWGEREESNSDISAAITIEVDVFGCSACQLEESVRFVVEQQSQVPVNSFSDKYILLIMGAHAELAVERNE